MGPLQIKVSFVLAVNWLRAPRGYFDFLRFYDIMYIEACGDGKTPQSSLKDCDRKDDTMKKYMVQSYETAYADVKEWQEFFERHGVRLQITEVQCIPKIYGDKDMPQTEEIGFAPVQVGMAVGSLPEEEILADFSYDEYFRVEEMFTTGKYRYYTSFDMYCVTAIEKLGLSLTLQMLDEWTAHMRRDGIAVKWKLDITGEQYKSDWPGRGSLLNDERLTIYPKANHLRDIVMKLNFSDIRQALLVMDYFYDLVVAGEGEEGKTIVEGLVEMLLNAVNDTIEDILDPN